MVYQTESSIKNTTNQSKPGKESSWMCVQHVQLLFSAAGLQVAASYCNNLPAFPMHGGHLYNNTKWLNELWNTATQEYPSVWKHYDEVNIHQGSISTNHTECEGKLLHTRHGQSACLSVAVLSPATTAQPIEMMFALRTRVGPSKMF